MSAPHSPVIETAVSAEDPGDDLVLSSIEARTGEFGGARLAAHHVSLLACLGLALALATAAGLAARASAPVPEPSQPSQPRDLAAFLAQADPAVLHFTAAGPAVVSARPPGWQRLDLTRRPVLDLGSSSASEAAASPAGPAAEPFVLTGPERAEAVHCLTTAIYYEAALEPRAGQEAVAQVVLNRVRHADYPKSVCGVVFQGADRPGCQFSFACDGSMARPPVAWAWKQSRDVAEQALSGYVQKSVGLATHYHTSWVDAPWTSTVTRVAQIGQHIFFRPRGAGGAPAAFRLAYRGGENAASRTWLIGKPEAAALPALTRVSTEGQLLAPKSIVQGGRTIALPPSTLFLGKVHGVLGHGGTIQPVTIPSSAMGAGLPPMHAMIAMRAAATRAVRAAEREQAALAAARQADEGVASAPPPG
jgi:hypothetical protein